MYVKTIIWLLPKHNVYQSIEYTINKAAIQAGFNVVKPLCRKIKVRIKKDLTIYYSSPPSKWNNQILITASPWIELYTFNTLIRKFKSIIVEEYYRRNLIKDSIASYLLKLFKNNSLFISQTKRTYHFLKSLRGNILFIPPAETEKEGSKEREYLLFVGRMIRTKNPLFAIKVAKALREQLVMIGRGPLLNLVKEKAKKFGNIKVIEYIKDRNELFNYYSKAKALIHPALKDPIGFVIIEALATQTPVVASKFVGASDFLPKEWVVNDFSIDNWTCAFKKIITADSQMIAKEIFKKEHLDLKDPIFDKLSERIAKWLNSRMNTNII